MLVSWFSTSFASTFTREFKDTHTVEKNHGFRIFYREMIKLREIAGALDKTMIVLKCLCSQNFLFFLDSLMASLKQHIQPVGNFLHNLSDNKTRSLPMDLGEVKFNPYLNIQEKRCSKA